MEFLVPGMFAMLGLIPVVIILHALRPRPKHVDVTNLFLWQELLKDRGGNLILKRLQKNLPMLLQILLVLLLGLALARPVWLHFSRQTGNMILVVDTSASMQTQVNADTTRFDLARQKVTELLDRQAARRVLLIEAGNEPAILSGFTENTAQVKTLIDDLQPADAPGKLEKAIYVALSFITPGSPDHIYVVTDGAGADFLKLLQLHQKIVPVVVGGGAQNAGITKFEFRQAFAHPDEYEILVELQNFTDAPLPGIFRLSIDNTTIAEASTTLNASEKRLMVLPYSGLITGIAKVELDIADDFPVDNQAYLVLNAAKDLWVLLASKENYFLEKLLATYPNFLINKVDEIVPSSWAEHLAGHDLVIVDRMDVPAITKGNLLLIDAFSPSIPVSKTGQSIEFPQIIDWDEKHPALRDVNLSGLKIQEAEHLQAVEPARSIVDAAQTGLMYAYEEGEIRALLIGFDVTRSDLPLKVAFPVMMSNIINWLNPYKLSFSALHTKAGDPFEVTVAQQTTEVSIRSPDGTWEKYPVSSDAVLYRHTERAGIYTILENKKSRYFTVNLLDEAESDIIAPAFDVVASAANPLADTEETTIRRQIWTWFLLVGMAMILLEWYAWLKVG